MTIEKALPDDLEQVAGLFDKYRQFYRQPSDLKAAMAFIRTRMDQSDSVILVARMTTGTLGGFTQLYPSFSSVRMARGWILNDLYVDAAWRKRGVGEALMNAAREFARQDGAVALWLATEKHNATAKRLYERLDYDLDRAFDHYELNL